jgi:hypothetical protein
VRAITLIQGPFRAAVLALVRLSPRAAVRWSLVAAASAALSCAGAKAPAGPLFPGLDDADAVLRRVDPDLDGVIGAADRCPDVPEDRDGSADGDGCPEAADGWADADHDGVPDALDGCPDAVELALVENGDGCPDADEDRDGIADNLDPCPFAPGTTCRAPVVASGPPERDSIHQETTP